MLLAAVLLFHEDQRIFLLSDCQTLKKALTQSGLLQHRGAAPASTQPSLRLVLAGDEGEISPWAQFP